ncbi:MAG: transcription factor FapR [Firmicutes bacterium]|nr:transcription factor FapR [Bacillota bacterium]
MMPQRSQRKQRRQQKLVSLLEDNPFLTDEEAALKFGVSIQTIRLDRLELGIPEMRKRSLKMAEKAYRELKTLNGMEIVGELYELELGQRALSLLETTPDMVFEKSQVVRGHYIYAQAESLAIALVDAEVALTGVANIKYKHPVYVGDKLVAQAKVTRRRGNKYFIWVRTRNQDKEVFRAKLILVSLT